MDRHVAAGRAGQCEGAAPVPRPAYQKLVLEQCVVTHLDTVVPTLCVKVFKWCSFRWRRGLPVQASVSHGTSRGPDCSRQAGSHACSQGQFKSSGSGAGLLFSGLPISQAPASGASGLRVEAHDKCHGAVLLCHCPVVLLGLFTFSLHLPAQFHGPQGGLCLPLEDLGRPGLGQGARDSE